MAVSKACHHNSVQILEKDMLHITVVAKVRPEFRARYKEAILRHANNSLTREEGCLGFAVHCHEIDPDRFLLYETYRSRKDFEEVHAVAPYLAEVNALVKPWVASQELQIWETVSPERQE